MFIGFTNMLGKYEILSSSINSVIMITLFPDKTFIKSANKNPCPIWNYWNAEATLSYQLNSHVPQLTEAENLFRSFQSKLRSFHFDEKEFSLLLLMILTRNSKKNKIFFHFNMKKNFIWNFLFSKI